nr:RHS repeat-associated core domain-containing protein [Paraburkholderia sp. BL6669N2]
MTGANGEVVWEPGFTGFGEYRGTEWLDDRPFDEALRFAGQYADEETGLHYNTFRYYDPATGRFVSQDPIGLAGGFNLYQYAANPVLWVDPWGLAGDPATATHITYQGLDAATGKPYVGYASMQGNQTAQDVLRYRYGNDFSRFGGQAPDILYEGYGQAGKDIARGLEQRTFENLGGLEGAANKQNPVGAGNARRTEYLSAADEHLNKTSGKPSESAGC